MSYCSTFARYRRNIALLVLIGSIVSSILVSHLVKSTSLNWFNKIFSLLNFMGLVIIIFFVIAIYILIISLRKVADEADLMGI